MKTRRPWLILSLAIAGIGVCALGLGGFIWSVFSNNLPWEPNQSARDYYLEIGNAFGDGFVIGFFMCFFLVLGVLTMGNLLGFLAPAAEPAVREKPPARKFRVIRGRRS